MTLHDDDCSRCGGAGGLYTDGVKTRFDVLCLACARRLAKQERHRAEDSGVVA
jgi:hypothetical protein